MKKIIDLTGKKFGNWLVLKEGKKKTYRTSTGAKMVHHTWRVQCKHIEKEVTGGSLRSGNSKGCPKCCGERQRKNTPDALRRKQEQYQKQNGLCGLCDKALPSNVGRCHWDHNHKTGKLRALVHPRCNHDIAVLENRPDIVEKVKDYLQSWK